MQKHWLKYPPVHVTAALFAGIKMTTGPQPLPAKSLDNAALVRDMHTDPRKLTWHTKVANG